MRAVFVEAYAANLSAVRVGTQPAAVPAVAREMARACGKGEWLPDKMPARPGSNTTIFTQLMASRAAARGLG